MSKVREAIEEMIEESYLLGLSEQEIRLDFKRFIDTCYNVIHENVKDRDVVSGLAENLAREQTCILIADRVEESEAELAVAEEGVGRESTELFAEKVARRKRQILKTIAEYDPHLVRLIDAQRFKGDLSKHGGSGTMGWRPWWRPSWEQLRLQLLKVGYGISIALIVLLIYLSFIQKS